MLLAVLAVFLPQGAIRVHRFGVPSTQPRKPGRHIFLSSIGVPLLGHRFKSHIDESHQIAIIYGCCFSPGFLPGFPSQERASNMLRAQSCPSGELPYREKKHSYLFAESGLLSTVTACVHGIRCAFLAVLLCVCCICTQLFE